MLPRPIRIERGRSYEIIEKLREQNFTGLLKVSFKTDEISKSDLIVEKGTPIAMETRKIRTGRILRGNKAFQDFLNADNCVAEFYLVGIENNPLFSLDSKLDLNTLFEVVDEVRTRGVEVEKLEKVAEEKLSEVDVKKLEISKILESEIGKIAKKYVKLLESVNSLEELLKTRDQIFEFLNSTTAFLPKEKIEKVKKEINRVFETLKVEHKEYAEEIDEFENFKKDLISKFDRVLGSRELREILEKLEDWSDLIQNYPQIKKVAGKFATIVPWNKVEELLRLIEEKIAEETRTRVR